MENKLEQAIFNTLEEEEKEILLDFMLVSENKIDEEDLKEKIKDFIEKSEYSEVEGFLEKLNNYEGDVNINLLKDLFIQVFFDIKNELEEKLSTVQEIISEHKDPIIKLRKGTLLVPIVGILDSARAQNLAEDLLEEIKETESLNVIVDVTGITTLDTIVAGFLIETFKAIRLLGAMPILCGISPSIAHSLVKVGVDLNMLKITMDLEEAINYVIKDGEEKKWK